MTHSLLQTSFPFDLPMEDGFLHCQKLLRTVPGKQLVIAGLWQKKPVLAKIFLNPISGWFEFNRALRGTQALLATGIATPMMVYSGYLKKSAAFIILFEQPNEAIAFNHRLQTPIPSLERFALLRQLVEIIVKQHQMGIIQTDWDLKNFLFSHNVLYSVETNSVRQQKQPLSIKKSLTLLALLLTQIALMEDKLKTQVLSWYFQLRGWSFNPHLLSYLDKQEAYWQTKREKTLRSTLFRASTKFVAEKTSRQFWVCDRSYLTDELLAWLKAPEYLFSSKTMRIIKDGDSTTVGVIPIADRYFLIKRHNIKQDFLHRLKRLLPKTRAKKSWERAHRLLFRGIRTAQPVAMIEKRWGILRGVCYFISEYVSGVTASEYFKPHQFDPTHGHAVAQQILQTLHNLAKKKIYHGDLKASNILINEKGIWLIDLDAVQFYRNNFYAHSRAQKDMQRFMRNWQQPMIRNLFT